MSRLPQLTSWQQQLASRFPDLPTPVIAVLALYSFGLLLAQVSGLSTIVLRLAKCLGGTTDALRKRLAEFYKEAPAKSGVQQGQKRKDFDVRTCFAPLLKWVLALWSGKHLALALDVTNLGDRFHVLCVSVLVRGVAIPVAWAVLAGGHKAAWKPLWRDLLQRLQPAVPADWTVLVLSDRGLESVDLFKAIQGCGWHPMMRVKKGGKFRPTGWGQFYLLGGLLRQVGSSLCLAGRAYTGARLPCTLLARWEDGYAEPWLILTDLEPEAGDAVWYGLRGWIEQGFKVLKGGGWDWQLTRMEDPGRVERVWLVLAVATLWVVALGADDEVKATAAAEQRRLERALAETAQQTQARQQREQARQDKQRQAQAARQARLQQRRAAKAAKAAAGKKKTKERKRVKKAAGEATRAYRVSSRGLAEWQAQWQRGQSPLPAQLHPEPWPQPRHPASSLTEAEFLAQQT